PFLVALLVVSAFASRAQAQTATPKEAPEFFRAAVAAYERGDYRAAAIAFDEAYRRAPRAAVRYNAGLAWEAAGALARAADAYGAVADSPDLDEPSRSDAQGRLAKLNAQLGTVRVTDPVGELVSIAHAERVRIPCVIHLRGGEYELHLIGGG